MKIETSSDGRIRIYQKNNKVSILECVFEKTIFEIEITVEQVENIKSQVDFINLFDAKK